MPKLATISEELTLMRAAAIRAGALALSFRKAGVKTWEKSPGHPVTEADLAVNRLLHDDLKGARSAYGWLSEETADDPEMRKGPRNWVVDPIDGTRAFMRPSDPHWCIGIALIEAGQVIASVIYAPAHQALYEAGRGGGAYRNGVKLIAGDAAAIAGCGMIASEEMIKHPAWPTPWPELRISRPKPNATLYRMALVAAGQYDATLALWRKSDWDLAAGSLLVEEAGGHATTHRGEPFRFNQPVPAQRSLLASGKRLHPLLVRRVNGVDLPDPQATGHAR